MQQRTAARLAWSLVALFVVVGTAAQVGQVRLHGWEESLDDSLFLPVFAAFSVVGAFVASRQPRNAVGWIFVGVATAAVVAFGSGILAIAAIRGGQASGWVPWVAWVSSWAWVVFFTPMVIFLPLLFPDGRLPSPRWRPYAWCVGVVMGALVTAFALDPGPLSGFRYAGVTNPVGVEAFEGVGEFLDGIGFLIPLVLGVISAGSLVVRYRRATGDVRDQIKWFVFAVAVLAAWLLITGGLSSFGVELPPLLDSIISALVFASLPVAAGIGILRYRLFDVDVVINRALVYGVLAAVITAVYVAVVVGIGALVGRRGNVLLSVLATALIALAFHPLRERVRHLANRLVYGERATPYEVLSEFSERAGTTYSLDDVLPRMARLVVEGTAATECRVWVRVGDALVVEAEWPPERPSDVRRITVAGEALPPIPASDRAIAVRQHGELLGALALSVSRAEPLTSAQERLLEDVASQAGLVLRNVRLIEELRASRARLVAAQDEERRRIERNIHDGAQQQLVALSVNLKLARTLAARDPEKAQDMLDRLQRDTQHALEDLRDLARGIYPPLLADKGLAAALEAQARKAPFPVEVDANGVARYSQEVEAAIYFCVLEALQNAAKYADASGVRVRLKAETGEVLFEVEDDGRGFDPLSTPKGSGLQNMADRLEALGGSIEVRSASGRGTRVTGRVPFARGERS